MHVYSAPRTIVDAYRMRAMLGPDVANEALRRWLRKGGQPFEALAIARACTPASSNIAASSSDAPSMTVGYAVKPGSDATNPTTFTTRVTRLSEPSSSVTAARALIALVRSRGRPRA